MSRIRFPLPIKLLPAALSAVLVMLGSATLANAQYYDQNAPYGAPQDPYGAPQDQYAQTDPPDRVARLAYLSGDVEFAPAGEDTWGSADVNRPLITGDRLLTGDGGRAALELGDAALRIDDDSAFNFLDLDDTTTQVELSQGTLNLRVRRIHDDQVYEIDTPTVAFVANGPGTYRVDVAPSGHGAMVTVFEGSGTVYGENGVSRPVQAGQSYRFNDSTLANVAVQGLPAPDDFDRFCEARDSRYANSVSRRYVSEDVVGYDDLDQYGDWQDTPDYGEVWYPSRVSAGWAPYRDGHWAWIEPWGWTWVDDEPWGYAPFHYGRWAYVRNRWGWVPGPRTVVPVYSPALVAFVGGSGFSVSVSVGGAQPVGWFPLGPRDVYVPPYRASRNYFTSVNVTNIRNVYVDKTVINNYYGSYAAGRPYAGARKYAYRNDPRAFTAVPRNVFTGARPVRTAVLHVKPAALARATVTPIPHVAPTRASLAIRPPKRPIAKPVVKAFDRTVVARHAPPPRPVSFATRQKVIASQGGAPIPIAKLRQMRQQHAKAQPQRVHVVAAAPKRGARPAAPGRAGNAPVNAAREKAPVVQAPRKGERAPQPAANRPGQAPAPSRAAATSRKEESLRPGELRSARFAHPHGRAEAQQKRAEQARPNAQPQAAQAQQNRKEAGQARAQEAQQRAGEERARQAQQQAQQQAQNAQARQHADQMHAQQAQQRAEKERAQRKQAEQQQHAQRQEQERARQEQQQRAEQQQHAHQQQQEQARQQRRAEQQQRAHQQEQARARQERQSHAEQARAQQQAHARQEQQRQSAQARQRQAQSHAQQQRQRAQGERQRHEPPPPKKQQHKKKDHGQQDDDGH
jgi:hypothetical protein